MNLKGVLIPLVTPFTEENRVDTRGISVLVNHYVAQGVGGIVACSTTGEAASLAHDEFLTVVRTTVEATAGRVPVLAGTGSSDTAKSIQLTREVERLGVDGALVILPFYSNPGAEGLYLHFQSVARSTGLQIVLYHVPMTGVSMSVDLVLRLVEIPNIVGIMDRGTDLKFMMEVLRRAPSEFMVLHGLSDYLFPAACIGVHGAAVPDAHVRTADFVRLFELASTGRLEEARQLSESLMPLTEILRSEPNPAPIKAALQILKLPGGAPRLPVAPATIKCRADLRAVIESPGPNGPPL